MQRVSTAFVGQVSAASSPAVAKLKGRARATNNSAYVSAREQPSRAVAPASRPCGTATDPQMVQLRKDAELTVAAETLRARAC